MKFVTLMVVGLLFCGPATGEGQYVKNPTAPSLTNCKTYWYHTDCTP